MAIEYLVWGALSIALVGGLLWMRREIRDIFRILDTAAAARAKRKRG